MDNHNWYFSSAKLSVNFFLAAQCGIGTLTFESYLDSNLVLLLIFCLLLGPIINSWSVSSFVKWGSIICLTGWSIKWPLWWLAQSLLFVLLLCSSQKGGCSHSSPPVCIPAVRKEKRGHRGGTFSSHKNTSQKLHTQLPHSSHWSGQGHLAVSKGSRETVFIPGIYSCAQLTFGRSVSEQEEEYPRLSSPGSRLWDKV